jgi:X-X-X-Leu-X-X-Gly heptad repeat protein
VVASGEVVDGLGELVDGVGEAVEGEGDVVSVVPFGLLIEPGLFVEPLP